MKTEVKCGVRGPESDPKRSMAAASVLTRARDRAASRVAQRNLHRHGSWRVLSAGHVSLPQGLRETTNCVRFA